MRWYGIAVHSRDGREGEDSNDILVVGPYTFPQIGSLGEKDFST